MMGKSTHCGDGSALLSSPLRGGRNEQASVFSPVATSIPHLAGGIPEGFPLGREVTVASWNTQKESIVLLELLSGNEGDVLALPRGVHFGEDLLWESLLDSSSKLRRSLIEIEGVDP